MPEHAVQPRIRPLPGLPGGPRRQIGRMLLSRGLVNIRQLAHAVTVQQTGLPRRGLAAGERLGTVLIRLGYVDAMHVVRALCDQAGHVNFLVFDRYLMEPPLARAIPRRLAHGMGVLPLVRLPGAEVLIATADGLAGVPLGRLARRLRAPVEPVVVRGCDVGGAIDACYDAIEARGTTPVRLGEMLVRDRLASAAEVAEALAEARRLGKPLGEVLVARGVVDERIIYLLLARKHRRRLVSARSVVDRREAAPLVARLSPAYVRHNQVLPYRRVGGTVLAVTSDPALDTVPLAEALGCRAVGLQLACRGDLAGLVEEVCRQAVA